MADASQNKPRIIPFVRYRDAPAAIDWLEKAFGFERHFVVEGEKGTVAHAQLELPGGMVMLGSQGPKDAANPMGGVVAGNYVIVDDIEAHYERAKAAGAEIVVELHNTDYGAREYAVRDPEGNLWSFGTYDPWAVENEPEA